MIGHWLLVVTPNELCVIITRQVRKDCIHIFICHLKTMSQVFGICDKKATIFHIVRQFIFTHQVFVCLFVYLFVFLSLWRNCTSKRK